MCKLKHFKLLLVEDMEGEEEEMEWMEEKEELE